MAPKAAMKRPAAAAAPKSVSKRPAVAEVDPVPGKCEVVQAAIGAATSLPEEIREMLGGMVASSLGVFSDQRHPYQARAAEWIGEALRSVGGSLETAVTEATATVEGSEGEKAAKETAKAESDAKLQSAKSAAQEMKDALAAAQASYKEAGGALSVAHGEQTSGDMEFASLAKKQEDLEACKATFKALQEGTVEADKVRESSTAVYRTSVDLGVNSSLLESLSSALQSAPDQRGQFTDLVLESFGKELDKILGDLGAKLEALKADTEAKTAAAAAAQATFDAQKEKLEASKVAVKEANQAVVDARQAAKDAAETLAAHGPLVVKAEAALVSAKNKLAKFHTGPFQTYTQLRDRSTPPPPPPAEEVPEEPAVAPAAEAETPVAAEAPAAPAAEA